VFARLLPRSPVLGGGRLTEYEGEQGEYDAAGHNGMIKQKGLDDKAKLG
jgi:hypothetical protein